MICVCQFKSITGFTASVAHSYGIVHRTMQFGHAMFDRCMWTTCWYSLFNKSTTSILWMWLTYWISTSCSQKTERVRQNISWYANGILGKNIHGNARILMILGYEFHKFCSFKRWVHCGLRTGSALAQVMACCLSDGTKSLPEPVLTYHYKQCPNGIHLRASSLEDIYTNQQNQIKIWYLKITSIFPRGQWVNSCRYHKTSNINRTLVGNKIVDNSDVVGASPVGAAPTTSSFST